MKRFINCSLILVVVLSLCLGICGLSWAAADNRRPSIFVNGMDIPGNYITNMAIRDLDGVKDNSLEITTSGELTDVFYFSSGSTEHEFFDTVSFGLHFLNATELLTLQSYGSDLLMDSRPLIDYTIALYWNSDDHNPVDIAVRGDDAVDLYDVIKQTDGSYAVIRVVPEPATMMLLGFALTGLALIRGKFKR